MFAPLLLAVPNTVALPLLLMVVAIAVPPARTVMYPMFAVALVALPPAVTVRYVPLPAVWLASV